ncbi:MAG TPA: phosphate ABC transporter permease PstA [Thermoplasmata archaeon]|nr:phosphate ABC transporter permease PstA [Thermoplasmata archaeon]
MKPYGRMRRKLVSYVMTALAGLSVVIILLPLSSILYTAAVRGGAAISPGFFVNSPADPCSPRPGVTCQIGGIAPAIEGTLILIGLAALIAVPIGISAAVFIVEYGRGRPLGRVISTTADVLSGVPSIVAGAFVYSLLVVYDPGIAFSALSGSLALSVLMIPVVTRTSEEALRTVPNSMREAALALGISKWKATLRIVLITALPGVVTGILLSVARAAGEAAPLLLTAFGSAHGFEGFNQPVDAMPLLIFNFATSPYSNWQTLAWGAALVLILLVLGMSLLSRLVIRRMTVRLRGG